jgi:hypothetical protein
MKKILIVIALSSSLFFTGCPLGMFKKDKPTPAINVWWGTKSEIKTFLDGPQAQAERWLIQSMGN